MAIDNPPPFAGGGAGRHAYKLAKALKQRRHTVSVLTPLCGSWKFRAREYDGVMTYFIPVPVRNFNTLFSIIYNLRLAWLLIKRHREYQVIHIQGIRAVTTILLISRLLHKKVFLTVLSQSYWQSLTARDTFSFLRRLRLKLVWGVEKFIVVSQVLNTLLVASQIPPKKITVIPNGTPVAAHHPDKKIARQKLGIPFDRTIVLYAGRFHHQKDIGFLIRAWKMLKAEQSHAQLILLGDGPEYKQILSLVEQLALNATVTCPGFVGHVDEFMQAADIFMLPSRIEGCSNALLEAMSFGLACIATDSHGNDEIILNEKNGYLVEFANEFALANRIKALVNNADLRREIGKAGFEYVRHTHALERTAHEHIKIFSDSLYAGAHS